MAKNNYPTRTTLWDDEPAASAPAPQPSTTRGAWRAPSSALADRSARRVAIPAPSDDLEFDASPIPRRTKFVVARTPWYRPRTSFGRILLATSAFILLGTIIAAVLITRAFLYRDQHFRIGAASSIQSTGLSEVSRADVLPVFGEDIGRNVFFVPLATRRKQLESIPWVQQATVMRYLPDHLSVSIVERTPVAFVRQGDQVQLADADGVILSMPPAMMAQHHYSFPVLTGIDARDSLAARRARMAVYQRFIAELNQSHQHLADQVSEIDLSDPEDLRATMPEQGSDILAHFGEDHFLDRLQIYKTRIAELRQRYPRLMGIDLRYNNEVILEMAGGSPSIAAPLTTAGPVDPRPHPAAVESPKPAAAKPAAAIPTAAASSESTYAPIAPPTSPTTTAKTSPTKPAIKPAPPKTSQTKLAQAKAAKLKAAKAKAAHDKAVHKKTAAQQHSAAHISTLNQ